jgi:uncharacterized repeat protein (TIGR02543 family)
LRANGFTRTGHTFAGWNTAANGSGTNYNNQQSVSNLRTTTDTFTLFAQWTPITYTVVFNGNGNTGGSMSNQTHTFGSSQALRNNAFTRTGHTFAGWNTAANGSGTNYSNQQSVLNLASTQGATFTLFARWTPHTYTVVFNRNGATGTMADQAISRDVATALTANGFTYTGRTFLGWATSQSRANEGTVAYTNRQSVTNLAAAGGSITLWAVWERHRTNFYTPQGATGLVQWFYTGETTDYGWDTYPLTTTMMEIAIARYGNRALRVRNHSGTDISNRTLQQVGNVARTAPVRIYTT